ncbi:MAG: transporter [Paludibacteraceae bacterium]|nr:transporter [Paludibacteraceae bacterium]
MKQFIKNWSLPIVMCLGVLLYIIAHALQLPTAVKDSINNGIKIVQPALIFSMLYLSFCKIDFKQLRLRPWHGYLLLVQIGIMGLLSTLLHFLPHNNWFILLECSLACFICPTATASVVIVEKLKGNPATLLMYNILINLSVAVTVPIFIPFFVQNEVGFLETFTSIVKQVCPVLMIPLILARLTNRYLPKLRDQIRKAKDAAFYLWMVALALAMATATRAFAHTNIDLMTVIGIMVITAITCLFQFYVGRKIGKPFGDSISAGQALGQKNTVFVIWLAYTFMDPICAVAGGFYSIWHNTVNSIQLYRNK